MSREENPDNITTMPTNIGTLSGTTTTYSAAALPEVGDPTQTFADETLRQYELEVGLTSEFEQELIAKTKQQQLIDTAQADVQSQQELAEGIVDRSRSRYGIETTQAFNQEQARATQRSGALIASDALNISRINQDELNTQLLNQLSNLSNEVNKQNLQMGASAVNQYTVMSNSYKNARAQHKANKYGIVGSFIGAL